jgi:CDP-diacylglycerol--glycerol-3-phosphate 3-phosphatidyltransferase
MNLPNTLTVARIFLVPLLVVVLLTKFPAPEILGVPKEVIAAGIFGLAALTDWLDGYLARRRKQVTTLGQLLDPFADKLLISAALISLVQMGLAPAWIVAVIIGREIWVTGLRSVAQARGITLPASSLGKAKMTSQVLAVLLLLLGREALPWLYPVGVIALWAVLVVAIVSAVDYYRRFTAGMNPRAPEFGAASPRAVERRVTNR